MPAIAFPALDPTAIEIGPFALRWYALAYVAGILLGWRHVLALAPASPAALDRRLLDDALLWATLGIVAGGRLGYALFYQAGHFARQPLEILYVWQGGMSFHGGMAGVAVAIFLLARARRRPVLALADLAACAAPIGLFFGRIANFINGELIGRPSDLPWAVLFPQDAATPRHPSQLYEALLEGVLLFVLLNLLWRRTALRKRPGALAGVFLAGYGALRFAVELVREPDGHLGFVLAGQTMGQLLSLPMIAAGAALLVLARPAAPART